MASREMSSSELLGGGGLGVVGRAAKREKIDGQAEATQGWA